MIWRRCQNTPFYYFSHQVNCLCRHRQRWPSAEVSHDWKWELNVAPQFEQVSDFTFMFSCWRETLHLGCLDIEIWMSHNQFIRIQISESLMCYWLAKIQWWFTTNPGSFPSGGRWPVPWYWFTDPAGTARTTELKLALPPLLFHSSLCLYPSSLSSLICFSIERLLGRQSRLIFFFSVNCKICH